MRHPRLLAFIVGLVSLVAVPRLAEARSPRNPYSSFNLSGINYGSMQWERAQRQGKQVWPYYNTPARSTSSGRSASVGAVSGSGGVVRTSPRRWRR